MSLAAAAGAQAAAPSAVMSAAKEAQAIEAAAAIVQQVCGSRERMQRHMAALHVQVARVLPLLDTASRHARGLPMTARFDVASPNIVTFVNTPQRRVLLNWAPLYLTLFCHVPRDVALNPTTLLTVLLPVIMEFLVPVDPVKRAFYTAKAIGGVVMQYTEQQMSGRNDEEDRQRVSQALQLYRATGNAAAVSDTRVSTAEKRKRNVTDAADEPDDDTAAALLCKLQRSE